MPPFVRRLLLTGLALAVAGCATLPRPPASEPVPLADAAPADFEPLPAPVAEPEPPPDPASDAVLRALGLLGVRYRFGGTTPETGFDCSGFVRWVFRDVPAALELPRASYDMARFAAPDVEPAALAPGDLVFFRIRGNRVSHVGIYIGESKFIHAPSRGGKVRVDRLDDRYWKRRYAGAKRILGAA
jgi:cell wall-associated NlpC family hydrolase